MRRPSMAQILRYLKLAMTGSQMFRISRVFRTEPKAKPATKQAQLRSFDAQRIVSGIRGSDLQTMMESFIALTGEGAFYGHLNDY